MASVVTLLPQSAQPVGSNYPELSVDAQERQVLGFDPSTTQSCDWTFIAPQSWTGTITAEIYYRMASATTGDVDLDIQVEAIADNESTTVSSFDTVNSLDNQTVPSTAGLIDIKTLTLTNNDGSLAGEMIRIRFSSDSAGTASGDLELFAIEIQDGA